MLQESRAGSKYSMLVFRLFLLVAFFAAFIPNINPARLSELMNRNTSLFTNAVSYGSITSNFGRALNQGWIDQSVLTLIYFAALVCMLATAGIAAAFCMSLGRTRLKKIGLYFSVGAAVVGFAGVCLFIFAYNLIETTADIGRINPIFPMGIIVFAGIYVLLALLTALNRFVLPPPLPGEEEQSAMEPKYSLFLMILPFLLLVALFAYLPLWGWRYAFFDYVPGFVLTMDDFIGFQLFQSLFSNAATRRDVVRVMTNTFAMSGIGLATSWLPIVFAVFLAELKFNPFKRTVQTLTTIPNFISWVLVYSVAFAIFSTEGFVNWLLITLGLQEQGTNFLMSRGNQWLNMWLWGTWKGLGWGAIIYIAGISSIDPQLYEAAMTDGAGRFRRMWHITVPGLMPTYFVMLLLAISNILSNGLDQYLVFQNPATRSSIEVLDLYIYNLGLGDGNNIPLATMMSMLKSVISVTLLFAANKVSKWIRGESIV